MADLEIAAIASLALVLSPMLFRLTTYLLTKLWKDRFITRCVAARELAAETEAVIRRLYEGAQRYPPTDPEPFGGKSQQLYLLLDTVSFVCTLKTRQQHGLLRRVPQHPSDLISWFITGFWSGPRTWHRLQREMGGVLNCIHALQVVVHTASDRLQHLENLAWEIVQWLRILKKMCEKSQRIGQVLVGKGLHGETVTTAMEGLRLLYTCLESLPPWFFGESDDLITKRVREELQATKTAAIAAWDIAERIESSVRTNRTKFRVWHTQYCQAGVLLDIMGKAMGAAREQIEQIPPSVEISALQDMTHKTGNEVQNIKELYRSLTIESLSEIGSKARRAAVSAGRVQERAGWIKREFDLLCERLDSNSKLLTSIEREIKKFGEVDRYRLQWQQSPIEWERLRELQKSIGIASTPRAAAEVSRHSAIAERLGYQATTLYQRVVSVNHQRERLVALLEDPRLAVAVEATAGAPKEYIAAAQYAFENWPKRDAVSTISTDSTQLMMRYRSLSLAGGGLPLQEDQVEKHLVSLDLLRWDILAFQERLERIRHQLLELQKKEQQGHRVLWVTLQTLNQLRIAGDVIESIKTEGNALQFRLTERRKDTVSEKIDRINKWAERCQRTLATHLGQLKTQTNEAESRLKAKVARIETVAPFSNEPAMNHAKDLLATTCDFSAAIPGTGSSRLEELVDRINERGDRLSHLNGAVAELERYIEVPTLSDAERLEEVERQVIDDSSAKTRIWRVR